MDKKVGAYEFKSVTPMPVQRREALSPIIYPEVLAAMKAVSITQEALAEILGFTPRTLRNKLTGRTPLSLDEAIAIRNNIAPGIDLETLFRREGKP